ncbi:MAG: ShlB/FhaC/HecB family hemolysin secretion/activation protein, partial [bacterium]
MRRFPPCRPRLLMVTRRLAAIFVLLTLAAPVDAWSQQGREIAPRQAPPLPGWLEGTAELKGALPPSPWSSEPSRSPRDGETSWIERVEFRGNTVVDQAILAAIAADFTGRSLSNPDLWALRDAITQAYVSRGFVTSGATLDLSRLVEGVLGIQVIEGRVTEIDVETDGSFLEPVLRRPLRQATRGVLNVADLERSLRTLQGNPQIVRLAARLSPGQTIGDSKLSVRVEEAPRLASWIAVSNDISPVIGGWRSVARLSAERMIGLGERLSIESSVGTDFWQINPSLRIPVFPFVSELDLYARYSEAKVVEEPFDVLDIESEVLTVGGRYRHALIADPAYEIAASLSAEWRESDSFLGGFGFDFTGSSDDGTTRVFVLRPALEGFWRSDQTAMALRSTMSVGVDVPGATNEENASADSHFVSWLGQLQIVRKLPVLQARLGFRVDAQLANDTLFGLERFSLGGSNSVRGYRENAIVRDNGVVVGTEIRVPVEQPWHWLDAELVAFADAGHGWNDRDRNSGPSTLVGIGGGIDLRFWKDVRLQVMWGSDLKEFPIRADR